MKPSYEARPRRSSPNRISAVNELLARFSVALYSLGPSIAILVVTGVFHTEAWSQTDKASEPEVQEVGARTLSQACVQCHGMETILLEGKTLDAWLVSIYSMISRGAPIFPSEIKPLAAFLAANYGPNFRRNSENSSD